MTFSFQQNFFRTVLEEDIMSQDNTTHGLTEGPHRNGPTMAEKADKHALYEESVQDVEHEAEFLAATFKALRGREAKLLREDFCGTANSSCYWVKINSEHQAIAVDIDPDVLAYGREKHVAKLPEEARMRVQLREGDVLTVDTPKADMLAGFNFSYWVFKDRETMKKYFRRAYDCLVDDGVFFLDAYGGSEALSEMEEETEYDDFTYVWDQDKFYPVSGDYKTMIHFRFPDGSEIKPAFSYNWRLWTLPEIQEMLRETGFKRVTVYWEGTDEDGEGDGVFTPDDKGEADEAWIAYIVAEK